MSLQRGAQPWIIFPLRNMSTAPRSDPVMRLFGALEPFDTSKSFEPLSDLNDPNESNDPDESNEFAR